MSESSHVTGSCVCGWSGSQDEFKYICGRRCCPKCREHVKIDTEVYILQCGITSRIKIGHSISPEDRMREIQRHSPTELILRGVIPGGKKLEFKIHEELANSRIHGEWFKPTNEVIKLVKSYGVDLKSPPKTREKTGLRYLQDELRRTKNKLRKTEREFRDFVEAVQSVALPFMQKLCREGYTKDDYVIMCAGSCYISNFRNYKNGTNIITVRGRETNKEGEGRWSGVAGVRST